MSASKDLLITVKNGLRIIKFNRPKKYNAISSQMYTDIKNALKEAAEDDETRITALTGAGDYYCSGNDLSNFATTDIGDGGMEAALEKAATNLREFVDAFISFPKLLVAVVNGPAIGIAATTLPLCDIAYASDKATFNTPFIHLGQVPEACSSYTFPLIMGHSLASEVLYMNRKLTASEALHCGLVSKVSENLDRDVWPMLEAKAANINHIALRHAKTLVRGKVLEHLREANKAECKRLQERWGSVDCMESIMTFLNRKSKL